MRSDRPRLYHPGPAASASGLLSGPPRTPKTPRPPNTDPTLAPVWKGGKRRRRTGQAPLVRVWAQHRALRQGLGEREAVDLLWALSGPEVCRLCVTECRWSPVRFERWLVGLLDSLLLKPAPREGRPGPRSSSPA